jgi:hypothetical protein
VVPFLLWETKEFGEQIWSSCINQDIITVVEIVGARPTRYMHTSIVTNRHKKKNSGTNLSGERSIRHSSIEQEKICVYLRRLWWWVAMGTYAHLRVRDALRVRG